MMPTANASTGADMSNYRPAGPQQPPAIPPADTGNGRSPVMLASLPGLNSGPDAVLRQFRGGRGAPQGRIYAR